MKLALPFVYHKAISRRSFFRGMASCSIFDWPLPPNTVLVLSGATAVGKSSVAMDLCRRVNGEIIVSDSVQVYKHLDIGSTKPSADEMAEIPHHLVNIAEPSNTLTTGDFCRYAADAITDILGRGKVPVLVGGSTMWIQWLVRGIPDAPKATPEVMARVSELLGDLEEKGQWDDAFQILLRYDPVRGPKIARNDWYRLRRYLEIGVQILETTTGETLNTPNEGGLLDGTRKSNITGEIDFRTIFLSEHRSELYHSIDGRCVDLLRMGLISETAALLERGVLRPEYPVSKAIGYRQTIDYLLREIPPTTAVPSPQPSPRRPPKKGLARRAEEQKKDPEMEAFVEYLAEYCTATRNYAKRQLNWYRKDHMFLFVDMNRKEVPKEVAYATAAEEVWHWATAPREEFEGALRRQVGVNAALAELRQRSQVPYDYLPDTPEKRIALSWLLHQRELRIPGAYNPGDDAVSPDNDVALLASEKKRRQREAALRARQAKLEAAKVPAEVATALVAEIAGQDPAGATVEEGNSRRPPPAWVECIQDERQGVTPETVAQGKPEWSALSIDLRSSGESKSHEMKLFQNHVLDTSRHASYVGFVEEARRCRERLQRDHAEVLTQFRQEQQQGQGQGQDQAAGEDFAG